MKPRWKLIAELLFGVAWIAAIAWWYPTFHENDPTPWQAIWFIIGLLSTLWGAGFIRRSWREL